MSFANPYFLIALAGAAAPLLIHLLTRDRIQHAPFSTLRFFAKGAKMVVRRKKFQEMILLLLRVALLLLLAIVFARPFIATKTVDTRKEYGKAVVVVADVSGSMQRPGLADQVKKDAADAVSSLGDADTGAVITFSDTPEVTAPMGAGLAEIKTAVDNIAPGYGGTNIAEALRKANDLLHAIRAKDKEIVLISDLQRDGWTYFKGDWKLASDVKLTVHGLKPSDPGNGLSIVEMSLPNSLVLDKQPVSIAVRLANSTDQAREKVDVALMLGGKKVDSQQVNVRANGTVAVRFRHTFDTPGDNPGSIVVGSDASTPANTVYFNARIMPRIPVLLINGNPSAKPQDDGAFYLGKALVPSDDSPFTVKTVTDTQVTPADVGAATVIVLANAGQVSQPVAQAIAAQVQKGGGVLFLPGDKVKADSFNAEFGAIAPCKLRQVLEAHPGNGETAESLTRIDFNHPIFDVFSLPHHGDLTLPKFSNYWETTDTQLSRVLARFGDGRPAMVEREVGQGVAIALVSPLDEKWTDFPRLSVFLPFVHQTVRYLAMQAGQQTAYTSGDLLPVPAGDSLKDPAGKTIPAPAAGAKSAFYAAQPGYYYALNAQGQPDFCYAVNGNLAESATTPVAADEIAAAIERSPDEVAAGGLDDGSSPEQAATGKKDTGWWWYILIAVVALSFAELIVGNKTLRH